MALTQDTDPNGANDTDPNSGSIGDPTLADAILDRVVHQAHTLDLDGESLRKNKKPE